MNPFEQGLAKAKVRQRKFYLFGAIGLLAISIVVGSVLLSAGGTTIVASPDAAEETASISVIDGAAVSIDNVVYSLSSSARIMLQAKGFRPVERMIEPYEKGQRITVILTELPSRLIAKTVPEHGKTRWYIDDIIVQSGKILDRELEPGAHQIRIDNPYFTVHERQIDFTRAETVEVAIELEPLAGSFSIKATPAGASISIDGELVGTSSASLKRPGGAYEISVSLDGYETTTETVELLNTAPTIERAYRLKPISASITVSAKPKGGKLFLDGRQIAQGKSYEVAGGKTHKLAYFKEGFLSESMDVDLAPNANEKVSIQLDPDIGVVEVKSHPEADIYILGSKVGKTPTALKLPALPVEIELRRQGYRTVVRKVTPTSKQTKVIIVELQEELAVRLAESPRIYKNSVGIELIRFKPSSFVMGAPRSEPGQRANEFQKSVVLTKLFYAAKHEVTNAQFSAFKSGSAGAGNLPVVNISWTDAAMFCNWLSDKENLKPVYLIVDGRLRSVNASADGYRMLSEAEWEWLARKAGKKKQTIFPWGDDQVVPKAAGNIADESANGMTKFYVPNYNDGYAKHSPVGSFDAEPSGLHDLTGNVSEWVHDYYSLSPPASGETFTDPMGARFGDAHVYKGSSWRSGTRSTLRAAHRNGATSPSDDLGFRIGRYLYGGENAQ